jgi:thiaminase/transcriptional activator TenA
MKTLPLLDLDYGLFGRLRRDSADAWHSYMHHPFLKALGAGTLPLDGFKNFLVQDYLYLIEYVRGYALGAYKSETLSEIRGASGMMTAILDVEMPLHIAYCADWGLTEAAMAAAPPDMRMIADPATVLDGNPYRPWIEAYADPAYRDAVQAAIRALDEAGARKGAAARYPSLLKTFRTASWLEADFWGIGWP